MNKITIDGKTMWQNSDGERLKDPDEKPDTFGWHKIEVDGYIMWESSEGERIK